MRRETTKVLTFAAAWSAAARFPFTVNSGDAGSSAASFFKFTPSPRGTGMGEAYPSITEDAYSAWWNPAGLASVEGPELAATYNDSMEDVTNQYLSLAYPIRYGSTLGLNITRLSVSPFQGYDARGTKSGKAESADIAAWAAYGWVLFKDEIERPVLNVGAGLKSISGKLDSASANTAALDLGAAYYGRPDNYWMNKAPAQEFRVGLAVKNIGPGWKFDRRSSPLPRSATLGGSWLSHPGGCASLVLSLDQTYANDEKYYAAFGAEYLAFQLLSLRAGYRTGQEIGSGLRFGVGFRLSFMDIDYSMSPYGELGAMHEPGVSMRFGPPVARQPLAGWTQRVEKAKLMSRKDLAARRYVSADANIQKAFNLEPNLKEGDWGRREKRLAAVIAGLKLADTPAREQTLSKNTEQSNVGAEAITAYIESKDLLKAFLFTHAALGANMRGDAMFEELLNIMSGLVKIHVRRDEILTKSALIKEKLRKAAKGFYIQQFDTAVKECEEVAELDEENPVAWSRLGSAYYMMGDKEKAKKAYKKAREFNPGDLVTKKFTDTQGWK